MQRSVFVVILVVLGLMPSGASATTPEECTSGPAHEASASRPHRVDPAADVGTLVTINGDSTGAPHPYGSELDLRALWVGVEETAPGSGIPRYTINAQVAGLTQHPVGGVYYLGIDNYTWASAAAMPDGEWEFGVGFYSATGPFGAVHTRAENTTGSVDTESATIRIVIPDSRVPGDETVPYARTGLRGGPLHSVAPPGTIAASEWMVYADTTSGTPACTAILDGLPPHQD